MLRAAIVVLALGLGCGSGERLGLADYLTNDEALDQLVKEKQEMERALGFPILLPSYLPGDVKWLANTHYVTDFAGTAYITFVPLEPHSDTTLPNIVEITEDPLEAIECPLCEEPGLEPIRVNGSPALADEVTAATNSVAYVIYIPVGDTFLTLRVDWEISRSTPPQLTDDMKGQVIAVAQSLVQPE